MTIENQVATTVINVDRDNPPVFNTRAWDNPTNAQGEVFTTFARSVHDPSDDASDYLQASEITDFAVADVDIILINSVFASVYTLLFNGSLAPPTTETVFLSNDGGSNFCTGHAVVSTTVRGWREGSACTHFTWNAAGLDALEIRYAWGEETFPQGVDVFAFRGTIDYQEVPNNPLADLGTFDIREISVIQQVNAIGKATINIQDTDFSQISLVKSGLLGKKVFIQDNRHGSYMFVGEIDHLRLSTHGYIVEATSLIKKLAFIRAKFNPILEEREIFHTIDNTIHDYTALFTTSDWDDKLITFTKFNPLSLKIFPTSVNTRKVSDDAPFTPQDTSGAPFDTRVGDASKLYFNNVLLTSGIYSYDDGGAGGTTDSVNYYDELLFDFYITDDIGVGEVKLEKLVIDFTPRNISGGTLGFNGDYINGTLPTIRFFDYGLGTWTAFETSNTIEINKDSFAAGQDGIFIVAQGGSGISRGRKMQLIIDFPVTDTTRDILTQIASDLGTFGTNYKGYRLRIAIDHGVDASFNNVADNSLSVQFAHMNLSINDNFKKQIPAFSLGRIKSTTTTSITLDNAAASAWLDKELPAEDGFGNQDRFRVIENVSETFDQMLIASDLKDNFSIEWEAGLGDLYAFDRDLTDEYILPIFQQVTRQVNAVYFGSWTGSSFDIKARTAANLTSTGITLTRADIMFYNRNGWTYDMNIDSVFNEVVVVGTGVRGRATGAPEFAFDAGDESLIINNADLESQKQVDDEAAAQQAHRSNARKEIEITLDFENAAKQNYGLIRIGDTIAVKIPTSGSPTFCDFSSGGADGEELMIKGLRYLRNSGTGWRDRVTLELQERE